MSILDKEQLRANLDEVIWNIEEARITVSEHHIVKLVTVAKYTEEENIKTLYELGQHPELRRGTLELNNPALWLFGISQGNHEFQPITPPHLGISSIKCPDAA